VSDRYAAIDCGTNALRLLIADVVGGSVHDVVREMRTVRLGEGVDATGRFSAAALERTFDACDEYAQLLSEHSVRKVRFVATSAARDVDNHDDFIEGVYSRLGVTPEVISGHEEAALSFHGAIGSLDEIRMPALVADIGGGSTEFVVGDRDGIRGSVSTPIGCVRMTERCLHSDPPTRAEIDAACAHIRASLREVPGSVPVRDAAQFIGVAGTVTTVVAMALDLPAYDARAIHGATITRAQVERVTDALLAMGHAQRRALPFMHPGRVDVIGGGALVLRESMAVLGLETVTASESDLLDGIVCTLALMDR
jgi:exopolyphosphatase/guanosine-5'-triphosphate,3'-diphosphate pyrophosphatase